MGTTKNKSTRKFSKRHLKKELDQRKKTQFVAKQRTERQQKLQKAVRQTQERQERIGEQRKAEDRVQYEKESFLKKPIVGDGEDLEEVVDEELVELELEDDAEVGSNPTEVNLVYAASTATETLDSSEEDAAGDDVEEEIAKYKDQLAELKEKDPEFYRYLREADEQLLQFQSPSDENAIAPGNAAPGDAQELDIEQVDSWCQDVLDEKPNPESLRFLMTAYAFACQYGETAEEEANDVQGLLQFSNPTVYSKVMLFVLKEGDLIFRKCLEIHGKQRMRSSEITTAAKKHADVAFQLNRFFLSTCRLLNQSLEDNVLAFVLRQIRSSVELMEAAPAKIAKLFLRLALKIFSTGGRPAPSLQAVLLIREMILKLGENTIDLCLKGVYRSFASSCAVVNQETMPQIYFMGTCAVEMYSLSPEKAYQNAFKFIKDLAIDLREAIIAKDKDAWKKVFSWKFVNCLELWARLVGALSDRGDIGQLSYPVAQLLIGAAKVQDQMRHVAMRLRLIASAISLSAETGHFIPVSSLLVGILSWSYLQKKSAMSGSQKCPNIALCLSVDEKTLKNAVFQSEVVEQTFELLAKHLAQLSHSIAFPEISHWIAHQLKRLAKSVQSASYKSGAMQLVTAIRESSEKVLSRRMLVSFSPRDIAQVEQFEVDGKATGESPLEILSHRLDDKRKQRTALHSTEVVTLKESETEVVLDAKRIGKDKQKNAVALSDAESLTSDDSEVERQAFGNVPSRLPLVDDVLEDYVLSEDEDHDTTGVCSTPSGKRRKLEERDERPKQKRRKEKRKMDRQRRLRTQGEDLKRL